MNTFARTRLLVVLAWCALSALPAQQATPRFVLPDVPYDYAPLAAPGLAAHYSLPGRNGIILCGCRPAPDPSMPPPRDRTNELATLGRVLFYDPLLSRNQTRSCASCHQQARAFADGQAHSRGFRGQTTRRNSMSIANLGLHDHGFFWDARAETLEQMVVMPIQDPIEMGMDLPGVLERLRTEPGYADLFARAFGDPTIDEKRLAEALAQFVRSIVSLRSRYDEGLAATGAVDKDFPNFTAAENRGKRLFFGEPRARARSCAACHVELHHFDCCSDTSRIEPVSLQSDVCRNNGLDVGRQTDDPGLARVTGKAEDRGKFRAPSLRNVELTGPYARRPLPDARAGDAVLFRPRARAPEPRRGVAARRGQAGMGTGRRDSRAGRSDDGRGAAAAVRRADEQSRTRGPGLVPEDADRLGAHARPALLRSVRAAARAVGFPFLPVRERGLEADHRDRDLDRGSDEKHGEPRRPTRGITRKERCADAHRRP